MLKDKRIVILGSPGQLGSWLFKQLIGSCQVVVGDNQFNGISPRLDINDTPLFNETMNAFGPDIIINCAAYTKVDAAETDNTPTPYYTNAFSVETVAKWCNKNGAKLVHISTDYVFGDKSKRNAIGQLGFPGWNEQDSPVPENVYAQSKYMGEHAATLHCKDAVVIRTSGLYGHASSLKKTSFVQAMLYASNDNVYVVDDQRVSPTYTKHLADAIIFLLKNHSYNSDKLFHIANTGSVSWFEFAEMIFRIHRDVYGVVGRTKKVIPITTEQYIDMQATHVKVAKRPRNSTLDCSKFHDLTECKMPTIEEALTEYILFLKKKQA